MKGTDEAFDAFMAAVQSQLLGPALGGDLQTYRQAGARILAKQQELNSKVLEELDRRLALRADAPRAAWRPSSSSSACSWRRRSTSSIPSTSSPTAACARCRSTSRP